MLFSSIPIRGLRPLMNGEPISINNDDAQYEAIKTHQHKYVKDSDTHKELLSFPIGSTVAMQHEYGGPWTHRIIKEANNSEHNGRSYIIRVIKIEKFITQNTRHIHSAPITREQYLRGQIK